MSVASLTLVSVAHIHEGDAETAADGGDDESGGDTAGGVPPLPAMSGGPRLL